MGVAEILWLKHCIMQYVICLYSQYYGFLQIIRTNDAERYIKVIPRSYEDLSLSDTDGIKVNNFA